MIEFKYRADVNGLRALAVGLVMLFHARLGFVGGFVGVDVFFVISGFLITGLVLKEQQSEKFSLANFWVRRIRRIIPAATAMTVAVLVAGGFLLLPHDYENVSKAAIAQQLMLSNFYFWQNTGYFTGIFESRPLLHTWSIAVEEQFYLVYPLLLVFLARYSKRAAIAVLLGIAALSLAASQWGVGHHPAATYYLFPTRSWELLIGGLICFAPAPTRLKSWHGDLLSWLALGAILTTAWSFSSGTPFPGLAALWPCGAAAVLIYVNSLRLTSVGRVLAAKPVVFVGQMSYSLYLWHWPLFAFFRYWQGPQIGALAGMLLLAASFASAYLSWRFIELPFRTSGRETPVFVPYVGALASMVIVIGLSVVVLSSEGMRARFPEKALAFVDGIDVSTAYQTDLEKVESGEFPRLGISNSAFDEIDFVIWGDSHAMSMAQLVDQLATKYGLSGVIAAQAGTIPLLDVWRPAEGLDGISKKSWNEKVFDYVHAHHVPNVFLASRWAVNVLGRPNGTMDTLIVDSASRSASPTEARDAFSRALNKTVTSLEKNGSRVWLIGQTPTQYENAPKKLFYAALCDQGVPSGVSLEQHLNRQTDVLNALSALGGHITFLDPTPYCFDDTGHSKIGNENKSFYCDDNHLTPYGAQVLLKDLLEPAFAEVAAKKGLRPTRDKDQPASAVFHGAQLP